MSFLKICLIVLCGLTLKASAGPLVPKMVFTKTHCFFFDMKSKRLIREDHEFHDRAQCTLEGAPMQLEVYQGKIYVLYSDKDFVSVYDEVTLELSGTLMIGANCVGIALLSDALVAIQNNDQRGFMTVKRCQLSPPFHVKSFEVGGQCLSFAVFKGQLYMVRQGSTFLYEIELSDRTLMTVGRDLTMFPIILFKAADHLYFLYMQNIADQKLYCDEVKFANGELLGFMNRTFPVSMEDAHLVLFAPHLCAAGKSALIRPLLDPKFRLMQADEDLESLLATIPHKMRGIKKREPHVFEVKRGFELFPRLVQVVILNFVDSRNKLNMILSLEETSKRSFLESGEWKNMRMHLFKTLMMYLYLEQDQKVLYLLERLGELGDPLVLKLISRE